METEKKEFSIEEAKSYLEAQVNQARYDLKENLLPNLGHGEKERLLLAISQYPQKEEDFSDDKKELNQAFSALKVCFDANVALGVEIVMEEMAREEMGKLEANKGNGNGL